MTRQTLGYVKLEWTCPNCGTRNPGPQKTCSNCGGAQPENVAFTEGASQELIQDQDELARAAAGPDVHCAFCGARNPAGAQTCTQCGADLKEGTARISGTVIGAYKAGEAPPVICPACAAPNPAAAQNCEKCGAPLGAAARPQEATPAAPANRKVLLYVVAGLGVLALICFFAVILPLFQRSDQSGVVQSREWQRLVAVEAFGPVSNSGWQDNIPSGAQVGQCERRYHHTQDTAADDSEQVCGTPYTIDKGSGYGQVVQDCVYKVYLQYCDYTIDDWSQVDVLTLEGSNDPPAWPETALANNQRYGERTENYIILFSAGGKTIDYTTTDQALFDRAVPGSRWTLTLNGLGSVVDIAPEE